MLKKCDFTSACRPTNTERLQNQKLVSALNRGGLWVITEDMQKIFLVVEKYFTFRVEKNIIRKKQFFRHESIFQ